MYLFVPSRSSRFVQALLDILSFYRLCVFLVLLPTACNYISRRLVFIHFVRKKTALQLHLDEEHAYRTCKNVGESMGNPPVVLDEGSSGSEEYAVEQSRRSV